MRKLLAEIMKADVAPETVLEYMACVKVMLDKLHEYSKEMGTEEPFLVYNNRRKDFDTESLVVTPDDAAGVEAIKTYIANCKDPILARDLQDWLNEFTVYRCRSIRRHLCTFKQSPVCCVS